MTLFNRIKPVALAILICVGLVAQSKPGYTQSTETLTVAGGCFWCVEADFEKVAGVIEAVSGYTGGTTENPTYKQVTRGCSGHYEAVKITFDPSIVSRSRLLSLFFQSIDPTDAGGQFCDRGESYRTAIFVSNTSEKTLATTAKVEAQATLGQSIVTPILDEAPFYPAEAYHQDYAKSDDLILTRFGPRKKSAAYTLYRSACGRDDRVRALWGDNAPFAGS